MLAIEPALSRVNYPQRYGTLVRASALPGAIAAAVGERSPRVAQALVADVIEGATIMMMMMVMVMMTMVMVQ